VAKELCFQAREKDLFFLEESIHTSSGAHKFPKWVLAPSFYGVKAARAQT